MSLARTCAQSTEQDPIKKRLWLRSLIWLMFLGPFFFVSYGFANWWTQHHANAGTFVFEWERNIPFVPWTIIPYWSIDLLYGLSFLLCRTRKEVDTHAFRLLTAQLISIGCFLLFPLQFSSTQPAETGAFRELFDALKSFDQPYNQAPSLHIALLIILWVRFAAATQGALRLCVHAWAILIGLSVLTTYQHHFIDVPTGALVGLVCLWLWPYPCITSPATRRLVSSWPRFCLGLCYLTAATACAGVAFHYRGAFLWLLWPSVAFGLVSVNYLVFGATGFQKHQGRHRVASFWLLLPYILLAWLNSRMWTWLHPEPTLMIDGVWLGRLPTRQQIQNGHFRAICDVAAELPCPQGNWLVSSIAMLDLVAPDQSELRLVALEIDQLRQQSPVLVCCALGYSRSAIAVAAWLLLTQRASTVAQAVEILTTQRPRIVLRVRHLAALETFHASLKISVSAC